MKEKSREEWFCELVPKAEKIHELTWCIRRQDTIPTAALVKARCWECPRFVLNEGICDPL